MKKYLPYIIFAILTILVVFPLYRHGFVFLLDMTWPPQIEMSDYLQNGIQPHLPLIWLIKVLSYLIPVSLIQKIILSLLLFLPGIFMYQLVEKLGTGKNKLIYHFSFPISILSGMFYMLNPWVYERFLAGHWLVLAGYVFLPLLIKLCWQFLTNNTNQNFIKLTILFALYPIISLHWFYISIFLLTAILLVYLATNKVKPNQQQVFKFCRYALILLGVFVLINSFWLINFLTPSSTFTKISFNDFLAFKTQTDTTWGPYFNTLSLYGFWNSDYFLPKDTLNSWWVLTFLNLSFLVIGIYYAFRKKKVVAMTLGILFIPSLLIVVGCGHWLTLPIVKALYYILPGFKGLRETAKLGGLLVFSYALLVPMGAYYLTKLLSNNPTDKLTKYYKYPIYLTAFLIPLLSVHNIFFAFSGQLKVSDYPRVWYQVNQVLTDDNKVLFLPWHGYPRLSFTNFKRVSNPASRFFQAEIVAGQSIDNVYLLETDQGIWDDKIFQLLHGFETIDENMDFLKSQGITYIILSKEMDYNRYAFLGDSEYLQVIMDTAEMIVYGLE